jgi:hypothetical protein
MTPTNNLQACLPCGGCSSLSRPHPTATTATSGRSAIDRRPDRDDRARVEPHPPRRIRQPPAAQLCRLHQSLQPANVTGPIEWPELARCRDEASR